MKTHKSKPGGFHYRKAVAPLKLQRVVIGADADLEFPLPKGGGPIEVALSSVAYTSPAGRFHYRKAVAPLKFEFGDRPIQAPQVSTTERRWPH